MEQVIKQVKGNKFIYTFKGEVVRTSTRDFKYACIAKVRCCKEANEKYWGVEMVASLGNNPESTKRSMAIRYAHYCDLFIVEIQ